MQPNSILAFAPSFSSYTSNQFAEIAAKVIREISIEEEIKEISLEEEEDYENPSISDSVPHLDQVSLNPPEQCSAEDDAGADGEDDESDFEFTFVCQDTDASPISADEIFSNGQIRPIFPIFNRDLVVEENDGSNRENRSTSIRLPLRKLLIGGRDPPPISSFSSTSSSLETDTLNRIPSETAYCVWTPKSMPPATPDRCKKSNSTGSSKRWRFRDLLPRSSSDGKETFVFLSTAAVKRGGKGEVLKDIKIDSSSSSSSPSSSGKGKAMSAHEMHYVRNRAMRESDRRRSYLPYRQDLVGFFANVNGLSKSLHPF